MGRLVSGSPGIAVRACSWTCEVPAGQSLLRALRSETKVDTRYGGGFVQSIDGLEGSARRHEDWFWFVNGLAGDRSAASYRSSRRRRRLVGLPRLVARCGHARSGRRRVPRAVPARIRREDAARSRAVRARPRAEARRGSPRFSAPTTSRPERLARSRRTPTSSRSSTGHATSDRRAAEARVGPVRCGLFSFAGSVDSAARRRLRAEVREPVSAGPATALLAAVATARRSWSTGSGRSRR